MKLLYNHATENHYIPSYIKYFPVLLKLLTLLSKLEDVEEVVLELRALATALLITGLKADITLFTIVLVLPALALLENLNDEMCKIIEQQFKVMILNYPSLF